jgi:Bacterial toxin of type II toxin-antitoxin system, YafQ
MRTIERTSAFKKDYKRIKANPRHRNIDPLLENALELLAADAPFATDHPLIGEWKDTGSAISNPICYWSTQNLTRQLCAWSGWAPIAICFDVQEPINSSCILHPSSALAVTEYTLQHRTRPAPKAFRDDFVACCIE